MCLPNTLKQAGLHKALQRALNALFAAYDMPNRVSVDSRIGPDTLTGAKIAARLLAIEGPASPEDLLGNLDWYTSEFARVANVSVNADPKPKPDEPPAVIPPDVEQTRAMNAMPPIAAGTHWGWYVAGTMVLGLSAVGAAVLYKRHKARKEAEESSFRWAAKRTRRGRR